ncbi:MAG: polysaccharide deacetylase family protein [Clostridium sp.]|jgi:peptidoglycan-N-acetylmuramic acid deacetylase|nr:polysaccharide deacetylase family protein [Clostridium sp.]
MKLKFRVGPFGGQGRGEKQTQEEKQKQGRFRKAVPTACFLAAVFLVGRTVGFAVRQADSRTAQIMEVENWGLGFGREGEQPSGNLSPQELAKYRAYFVGDQKEKRIYLTFDCGYENGNTPMILDALKKHQAAATFFVVGHYLESASELVKRMVEEGHTVANHTYHHPDMSAIASREAFQEEMDSVAALFREITGKELAPYYRPPQGKYSMENLKMAYDLGYATFFWSLAYVDWKQDQQPSGKEALEKLTKRIHPGAIVLLHNTSRTNGEILDELLTKWEEMGYTFHPLSELAGQAQAGGQPSSDGQTPTVGQE